MAKLPTDSADWETWWVRKCAEYRPSVLRVECGSSIGTGWIAAARPDAFLLVTAKHVVSNLAQLPSLTLFKDGEVNGLTASVTEGNLTLGRANVDIAVVRIDERPPGPSLQMVVQEHRQAGSLWVAVPPLGIDVGWIGFPETTFRVFGRPTLTFCRGNISAIGPGRAGSHLLCLDGNVNRGMSGGPVWDSNGHVLGMVVAYQGPPIVGQPVAWPGYGLVISVAYIWDTLKQAGAQGVTPDDTGRVPTSSALPLSRAA